MIIMLTSDSYCSSSFNFKINCHSIPLLQFMLKAYLYLSKLIIIACDFVPRLYTQTSGGGLAKEGGGICLGIRLDKYSYVN